MALSLAACAFEAHTCTSLQSLWGRRFSAFFGYVYADSFDSLLRNPDYSFDTDPRKHSLVPCHASAYCELFEVPASSCSFSVLPYYFDYDEYSGRKRQNNTVDSLIGDYVVHAYHSGGS